LCAQGDPIAAVGAMFERAGELFGGNGCKAGCFIGNIASEMSDANEKFRQRIGDFFKEWAGGMAGCLSRAQKAGLFGPGLDPRAAAEAILSLYEGAILMARAERDATVFSRVGPVAQSILTQHRSVQPTVTS
jgi:TetR/AcrR family transcriptional repressor of nem operon